MTALNFLKLADRQMVPDDDDHVIALNSWKLRKFNAPQLERVISTFGLDLSDIKLHPHYEDLIHDGAIAA